MAVAKEDIIKAIEGMTILELSELVKGLEERFGVSATAPVAVMAAPSSSTGGAAPKVEEKTEFTVELTSAGPNRMQVIKEVRAITGLGLKESKELVDSVPRVIKEGVSKGEAEEIRKRLVGAGAEVGIK
ncbi:MAG: 50S ribosomal protein L7/L12 [bacterium]